MADAPTPEQRRRVARLSDHEAATDAPSLVVLTKRLVGSVDALPRAAQLALAADLSQDWGRIWWGCEADRNRGRYSIYRRDTDQIQALHDELDGLLPIAHGAFAAQPATANVTGERNPED